MMVRDEREPAGGEFIVTKKLLLNRQSRTLLDSIDLKVHRGELLAVVGANGAGKSSLLKCLRDVGARAQGCAAGDANQREGDQQE